MPDTDQLRSLIRLFGDESPKVQQAVFNKLLSYGPTLPELLRELEPPIKLETQQALLAALEEFRRGSSFPESFQPSPLFRPGQLVKHRRYGYRGVVVDYDLECKAGEDWYQTNNTQPDKMQPWYHVLVHNSASTTYAAQTSLMPDESTDPILHPWVDYFFESFSDGCYLRNNNPWPKEDS
ncbi:MAG: heat shock protein HspQ [Planctomycetota bacterium]|jgi:heat shock protein HspQ|nr:heat shock protein HspQ [Planctomycetota bacterium]MDP6502104.1 heat shock protein HspQ [Planctomycetota bacterium]